MAKKKQSDYLAGMGADFSLEPIESDDKSPFLPDRTDDTEASDKAESVAVVSFLDQAQSNVDKVLGAKYIVRLIFVTEDQAAEFLKKANWTQIGHPDQMCVDGLDVAASLRVSLTPESVPFRGERAEKRAINGTGIIPNYPTRST